jgi:hypothetical protein
MSLNDYNDPNEVWRRTGYNPYKNNEKEKLKTSCLQGLVLFIMAMVGLLLCALLQGCKSIEYVPVIEHKTDTVRVNVTQRDSVYLHDSIMVWQKGDTMTIDRWHTKYVLKEVHDTTYISKTDSVPAPYPVVKEVPAELSTWQSFRMTLGTIAMCLLVLYFIYRIIRKRFFP